ncbi:chorismate synthase [Oleidesulfovibrio alaskensis]|uniref:chorismate synthase n=1 Tax=Oleidesulfovibrio alaskensis TaxID=58180 RepID=UPI0003F76D38|nr:chorismate synthase [Oleidesulfovibrio alaskensis]
MSGSTFGRVFRLTTYGESHGAGLGGVVDGCPAGIALTEAMIQAELDRRRPGQGGPAATARKEPDRVRLLSGVFEGRTTGTPVAFHVENTDQRSRDYGDIMHVYRPGHADVTYDAKYGRRDYRGGGRSSGRETLSRVAGGAVAQALLAECGITVNAFTVELGGVPARPEDPAGAQDRPFFAPEEDIVAQWDALVRNVKGRGDTVGGIVQVEAYGVPAGLGEPVFDRLDARLACALMSVGAVKGVEIGAGFAAARLTGSSNNDAMTARGYAGNNAGGILGGISSGQTVVARAAVKPIPSIAQEQHTVDDSGREVILRVGGRHDISAIPRIVPVLKAMTALTLADMLLMQRRMTAVRA